MNEYYCPAPDPGPPERTQPYQTRRVCRTKQRTPARLRAAARRRKAKAAKAHKRAIKIALATKRNRAARARPPA